MAMDTFSWSDSIQAAFASCLGPCLRRTSTPTSSSNTPGPDLQRLLTDDASTDTEAETLSLHSTFTDRRRKKKRGWARKPKRISIWGYDLFGRPPIQLPPDEEEEGEETERRGRRRARPRLSSRVSMDSDAEPVDASTIEQLSSPSKLPQQPLPHPAMDPHMEDEEAQRAREKEERRARRRERKEMKRLALALAQDGAAADDGAFEGFQGSGPGGIPSPFRRGALPVSPSQSSHPSAVEGEVDDQQRAYEAAQAQMDADADFGGETYAKRPRAGTLLSESRSSDSRSRSSNGLASPGVQQGEGAPFLAQLEKRKKKKRSAKSGTSGSTQSRSDSLMSPATGAFSIGETGYPAADEFEGFPGGADETAPRQREELPSAGFGVRGRGGDAGAFLARRGDE